MNGKGLLIPLSGRICGCMFILTSYEKRMCSKLKPQYGPEVSFQLHSQNLFFYHPRMQVVNNFNQCLSVCMFFHICVCLYLQQHLNCRK